MIPLIVQKLDEDQTIAAIIFTLANAIGLWILSQKYHFGQELVITWLLGLVAVIVLLKVVRLNLPLLYALLIGAGPTLSSILILRMAGFFNGSSTCHFYTGALSFFMYPFLFIGLVIFALLCVAQMFGTKFVLKYLGIELPKLDPIVWGIYFSPAIFSIISLFINCRGYGSGGF